LLTTGSGLLRYAMKDRLRVVEPLHTCPCFEFLGRMDGIDLVGEKLSSELAITLLNRLPQTLPDQRFLPLSLLALPVTPTLPCYLVLCEIPEALDGPTRTRLQHEVQVQVEQALQTHFHYRLARDLGQLGPVVALCSVDARALYLTRSVQRGMIAGNVKIEPLLLWDQPWPAAFHDRFGGMQTVCTEVDDVCDA
ncbi:MAG: GH3 auxin-responsive promoter family protein, partial [Gammaproteobacteria bacterium]|nr:GH3 auxin-responsive promoter family protein [Gammaproteobacteria bacterium]